MGLFSFLKSKVSKTDNTVNKYVKGMGKSRDAFASKFSNLSKKYSSINESYFEEVEELLIEADVGVNLTLNIIEKVFGRAKKDKISSPKEINEILFEELFSSYITSGEQIESDIKFEENGPTVLLVVGVNGVGKTTSIAKLANRYAKEGKKILLVAADTFRAGAVEQLGVWADRLGIKLIKGEPNGDPASVTYNGVKYAKEYKFDLVIVDTAGRLQTKSNLMDELGKINRVISKELGHEANETFLIIDATTGQNGVVQAKAFNEVTKITGVVITKMDGTSKGGIILAIRDELGVPVRFIGLGEGIEDLEPFDLNKYLYGLLMDEENE